jgi:hypothetical protein
MKTSVKSSIKKQIRIHLLGLSSVMTAMSFNACSTMKPIVVEDSAKEVQSSNAPVKQSNSKEKITTRAPASDGKEGGNGGSNIEVDFMTYGMKFYKFLLTDEGKVLFPEVDADLFKKSMNDSELDVVRREIKDRDGKVKTSRNIKVGSDILIEINRKAWRRDSKKPITQLKHAVHEYMGAVGIGGEEERLKYTLTQRIDSDTAMKILTGVKTLTAFLNPVDAGEALLAEKEAQLSEEERKAIQQKESETAALISEEEKKAFKKKLDLASRSTMECVDDVLKNRLGGKFAVDYSVEILRHLRGTRAEAQTKKEFNGISESLKFCQTILASGKKVKTKRSMMLEYAQSQADDAKEPLYEVVAGILKPQTLSCTSYNLNFSATAVIVGPSVGMGAVDCTLTNGRRWIGFGPNLGFQAFGAGATIEWTKTTKIDAGTIFTVRDVKHTNVLGSPVVFMGDASFDEVRSVLLDHQTWMDIGSLFGKDWSPSQVLYGYDRDPSAKMRAVGFEYVSISAKGGLRIPFLPLKTNWSPVLDRL